MRDLQYTALLINLLRRRMHNLLGQWGAQHRLTKEASDTVTVSISPKSVPKDNRTKSQVPTAKVHTLIYESVANDCKMGNSHKGGNKTFMKCDLNASLGSGSSSLSEHFLGTYIPTSQEAYWQYLKDTGLS